jgi:hypothetical protein
MHTFSGRTIDVPAMFIGGKSDWGVYQTPGAAESMRITACTHMMGFHLVDATGPFTCGEFGGRRHPDRGSHLRTRFANPPKLARVTIKPLFCKRSTLSASRELLCHRRPSAANSRAAKRPLRFAIYFRIKICSNTKWRRGPETKVLIYPSRTFGRVAPFGDLGASGSSGQDINEANWNIACGHPCRMAGWPT